MRLSIQITSVKTLLEKQLNNIIGGIHQWLNHIYLIQINVKFQNITYIWTSAYELFTWLYIVGGLKREEKTRIQFRKWFPTANFLRQWVPMCTETGMYLLPLWTSAVYGWTGHMKRPWFGGTLGNGQEKYRGINYWERVFAFKVGLLRCSVVKVLAGKAQGPECKSSAPT